ncbi:MAG TPA: hypothetical protein PLA43_20575 [Bryobacteraceae bacterium]|nr:hypothetical protein [Bryobacteraceae bacterium]HPU74356.1 hypothetical protein [Bryobacteraceae bacterium]
MANESNPKLRVISIKPRQLKLDFVTDKDLEEVVAWQDVEWKANLEAARKIEAIETRLKNGARLVARKFYFDHERRMVRTRKDSMGGR